MRGTTPDQRPLRIFIATLVTETNTFSSIPTGMRSYVEMGFARKDKSRRDPDANPVHSEWRKCAELDGHEVVESISAESQPAGITTRETYEQLREYILEDLRIAGRIDVVLLWLHGAMVAVDYPDCEGDLITRIREQVGPDVGIGIELDLHCHLSTAMTSQSDILVSYKEYPHTDISSCAREVYKLTIAALKDVRPVKSVKDCRMIGLWPTTREPVRSFVDKIRKIEAQKGVLSISLVHSFPWSDVPDIGSKILVISDGNAKLADELAETLAKEWWDMREAARTPHIGIDDALLLAARTKCEKPLVLADVADNPGGGAPGDNTSILRRALELGVKDIAIASIWDPVAVQMCLDAGVGATIDLRIGGKTGRCSDQPVDLSAKIIKVSDAHWQTGLFSAVSNLGPSAYIIANDIHIIMSAIREQVYHPDIFENIGCKLLGKRALIVKSTQHFHDRFAPIANEILYVAGTGPLRPDFEKIELKCVKKSLWPSGEADEQL